MKVARNLRRPGGKSSRIAAMSWEARRSGMGLGESRGLIPLWSLGNHRLKKSGREHVKLFYSPCNCISKILDDNLIVISIGDRIGPVRDAKLSKRRRKTGSHGSLGTHSTGISDVTPGDINYKILLVASLLLTATSTLCYHPRR